MENEEIINPDNQETTTEELTPKATEENLADQELPTPSEDDAALLSETADEGGKSEDVENPAMQELGNTNEEPSATAEDISVTQNVKDLVTNAENQSVERTPGNPAGIATSYVPPVRDVKIPQQVEMGRNGRTSIPHGEANYSGGAI